MVIVPDDYLLDYEPASFPLVHTYITAEISFFVTLGKAVKILEQTLRGLMFMRVSLA